MQLQWGDASNEAAMVLSHNEAGRLIWREQTEVERLVQEMLEDGDLE
jgi:hypothetical protein